MLGTLNLDDTLSKDEKIKQLLDLATQRCSIISGKRFSDKQLCTYKYDSQKAVEELGLDDELVSQLVEDYISQILKTQSQFDNYIDNITRLKNIDRDAKFIDLKNLAHKNLGVARNLRIEDAEFLLAELMLSDDVEYLKDCLVALEACAFRLNPGYAFGILQVMKLKNSF